MGDGLEAGHKYYCMQNYFSQSFKRQVSVGSACALGGRLHVSRRDTQIWVTQIWVKSNLGDFTQICHLDLGDSNLGEIKSG